MEMGRILQRLNREDVELFRRINGGTKHPASEFWLSRLTHLGGATATIAICVLLWLLAPLPWSRTALLSLIALAASHLPVAVIKRTYRRLRPYLTLPGTTTVKNPLVDHSFPSGHTTAIFSVIMPFVMHAPYLGLILLPLALTIGYSRMYLGLHYPSDVAAGALLGSISGVLISVLAV
jgi:undecaprenyl-diphosphatase